jgi:glutathione synthase/RimK-type ligase-like ATP-grasp enzyme
MTFPIIVRPIESHAGTGLEKLDQAGGLTTYLAGQADEAFYISPFVDYASPDGLFRKQRIALIRGRPFVCHLAVSAHWMVHYLNAAMLDDAENRAFEARFMQSFDQDFAVRHRAAFAALHARIGLDYFAIDCAETQDGRLLLFEADVAMIVHDMDPPDLFPYKKPQMRKVFDAFQTMLREAAAR